MLLKKLIKYFIQPGYTLGVGVFFGSSNAKKQHRKLIRYSHPNLPRYQAQTAFILISLSWYLVFFWIHLISFSLKKGHVKPIKSNDNNLLNTIKNILYLGLWIGVSPYNLYTLNLGNVQQKKWWNYIFLEEAVTWYTHLNYTNRHRANTHQKSVSRDVNNLNNKNEFNLILRQQNLPCIDTLSVLKKNELISPEKFNSLIEEHQGLFIKPISKNGMRGCVSITQCKSVNTIQATGKKLNGEYIALENKPKILSFINSIQKNSEILVQPLLINRADISSTIKQTYPEADTHKLITIRVITHLETNNTSEPSKVIFAILETPMKRQKDVSSFELNKIDLESGYIELTNTKQKRLPEWQEVKMLAEKAHLLFPEIQTIGWDVSLTEKGIKILEGNFGWNAIVIQHIHNTPMLEFLNNTE